MLAELVDDESPEDPPPTMSRGDVYRPTTMPAGGGLLGGGGGSSGEDNLAVAVDTDFPTVFQSSEDGRM